MRKIWLQRIAVVLFSSALSLIAVEVAVRLLGSVDADGQFSFMGHRLRPYRLSATSMEQSVNQYFNRQDKVRYLYDEILGWTYFPSREIAPDFTINSAGLRSETEYSLTPRPDVLRIALFGDSFIAGDEVADRETVGDYLEDGLLERGVNVEVLNFGVGGYGMDQAYLRWQSLGRNYSPDFVIFGFNPENMYRNLNILPVYLRQNAAPFSKPRFVLDHNALLLVNSPPIPPQDLAKVYMNFGEHPLSRYELFFDSNYAQHWWLESKFVALIDNFIQNPIGIPPPLSVAAFQEGSEYAQIAEAIVDAFARDVVAEGEKFIVLHLPHPLALQLFLNRQPVTFEFLLDNFATKFHLVRAEEAFSSWDERYRMPGSHYSVEGNMIIASKLADDLVACLVSQECLPDRVSLSEIRH